VVAVERRASFVVNNAPRVEVRLARLVAFLEASDPAFGGLDRQSNPFLDKVRG